MNNLHNQSGKNGINDQTVYESDATISESLDALHPESLSQFRSYRVLELFPAAGAEADIYKISKDGRIYILKLYRYGSNPNLEALKKVKEIGEKFPGDVVRIYESDFTEDLKRYFEVMEYVEYGSLRDLLADKNYMSGNRLKDILAEILKGLKTLHANNLIHLDLKPSNVLVRSRDPLDLVFTDFGVSSVIDDEVSRKMTLGLTGTPAYWSPEAFTQIIGRESDFWSLGMIILEHLSGCHPFQGQDMRNIMYRLSTKGVEIPAGIDGSWRLLLSGLLTRNPRKRWGFEQVRKWLAGEREIPTHFDFLPETRKYQKPFSFRGEDVFSLEELLHSVIRNEDHWEVGRTALGKGFIEEWLRINRDYDNNLIVEKLRKLAGSDIDFALVKLVLAYLKGNGFVYYGKLITFENVFLFTSRVAARKNTQGEACIVRAVISGALLVYYRDYLLSIQKDPDKDEFHQLLEVMKYNLPRVSFDESLISLFRIFDFWWKPGEFYFPENCTVREKVFFIKNHADCLLKKRELQEIKKKFAVPEELEENLLSREIETVIDSLLIMKKIRENNALIEKDNIPEVFSVKEYLEIGRIWKNKVDLSLYLKLPDLIKALESPRYQNYEIGKLREYLQILKSLDTEWKPFDKEIIREVLKAGVIPYSCRNKAIFSILFGIAFWLISSIVFIFLAAFVSLVSNQMPFSESTLNLPALAVGLWAGTYFAIDSYNGERVIPFCKGFLIGTICTLLIEYSVQWLVGSGDSLAILGCAEFSLGFIFYFFWREYHLETRYKHVYERNLYRILEIVNFTIH
ncbi:MAG: serine/threonine-protein kinase [Candidatus Wallbacteria bacterium]|nr:serine/threonine-protein kinase [Candidatus Wallbacteria bacterium]